MRETLLSIVPDKKYIGNILFWTCANSFLVNVLYNVKPAERNTLHMIRLLYITYRFYVEDLIYITARAYMS